VPRNADGNVPSMIVRPSGRGCILDAMQFATLIRTRMPRSNCPEHRVKTTGVPWAAPQGRFTLLFERFAVEVLLASGSIRQGYKLLGICWDTAQEFMCRAVGRDLERRQLEDLKQLGMDEKSFKRGAFLHHASGC
jgi:transposase